MPFQLVYGTRMNSYYYVYIKNSSVISNLYPKLSLDNIY